MAVPGGWVFIAAEHADSDIVQIGCTNRPIQVRCWELGLHCLASSYVEPSPWRVKRALCLAFTAHRVDYERFAIDPYLNARAFADIVMQAAQRM